MSEESKELLVVDSKTVQNLVYTIRGQQVMLDSDLAELYGYEVKRLNEQVRRNITIAKLFFLLFLYFCYIEDLQIFLMM